jgi:hypothetical protein
MRAHLSPILAASPFPAARATAMNERPLLLESPPHTERASPTASRSPHREPDPASDDVSLDHREGNRALKNGPGRSRYLMSTGVIREPGGVPGWRHPR